jgi:hypothetical protein
MKLFFVFLLFATIIPLVHSVWKTNKFDSGLQAKTTFDFVFPSSSAQISFAINCSTPCRIELVKSADAQRIKQNQSISDYPIFYAVNSIYVSETNVNLTQLSQGLSVIVKNSGSFAYNVWVEWSYFYTPDSTITSEQIAYIVVGLVGGICVCFAIMGTVVGLILFYVFQKKFGAKQKNDW